MEPLKDPFGDRQCNTQHPPPHKPLDHSILFPESLKQAQKEIPDWKVLKNHLTVEGRVSKADCVQLTVQASEIMRKEPNII